MKIEIFAIINSDPCCSQRYAPVHLTSYWSFQVFFSLLVWIDSDLASLIFADLNIFSKRADDEELFTETRLGTKCSIMKVALILENLPGLSITSNTLLAKISSSQLLSEFHSKSPSNLETKARLLSLNKHF